MKIIGCMNSSYNRQEGLKPDSSEAFANWLRSPCKQNRDDEYYRQHQGQLQPSELTFKPATIEEHSSPVNLACPEIKISTPDILSVEVQSLPVDETEKMTLPARQLPDCEYEPIIETRIAEPKIPQHPIMYEDTKAPMKILCKSPEKWPSSSAVFQFISSEQKHHLYTDKNEVELSMNTNGLAKEESIALQQTVKQWITQKGWALRQLIINGVKQ